MLDGTKKLFPNDYERFKEAMIRAADADELPVRLQLEEIRDYTLKDLQDAFSDFSMETGLEMEGSLFLCRDCGRMHLQLEVSREKREKPHLLQ